MKNIVRAVSLCVMLLSVSAASAQNFKLSDEYLEQSAQLTGSIGLVDWPPPPVSAPAAFSDVVPETPLASPVYDPEKGGALAAAARKGNIGAFTKKCYEYVAYHMEDAGVITRQGWIDLGIEPEYAARASDFALWSTKNAELMRESLKLVRIPTPESKQDVPLGSILVYEKGACGFSSSSGHIEILVEPDWACSDGCESLDQSCFSDSSERERMHVLIPVKK